MTLVRVCYVSGQFQTAMYASHRNIYELFWLVTEMFHGSYKLVRLSKFWPKLYHRLLPVFENRLKWIGVSNLVFTPSKYNPAYPSSWFVVDWLHI